MSDNCDLCGREIQSATFEAAGERSFCSSGCHDVYATLGAADSSDGARTATASEVDPGDDPASSDGDRSRTFLRIDGMYSATCEAYLESVAEEQAGVTGAEASYVTETIRVVHDPDTASKESLRDALSTLGYTAYLREDASSDASEAGGATRRAREMGGIRKRRDDQLLGMRYSVGFLFGAFLLVPYVAILYPAHLASIFDLQALAIFEGAFQLTSQGAFVFLRLYFVMTGIILVFTGLPVLRGAYISLKMWRPNTDLLVAITAVSAYAYSTAAVVLGRNDIFYDLAIVVTAAVTAVAFYESRIKQRALDRLTELTISQVERARTYSAGETAEVRVEDLNPGDVVLVRRGERVPVDGELVEDGCTIDEAIVTGESLPVPKRAGDEVIGGSIVTDGAALVRVGPDVTSSIDRITTAVWDLQSATHGVQRHADRLATYAVLLVVGVAIAVGGTGVVAFGMAVSNGALLALLILLAGSPWGLGLATPLSVAKSLSSALDRGMIIFDETVFERLRDVDTVVFDKTGTLTTGEMEVIEADAPAELLDAVAALEQRASHPAANAITAAFADESMTDGGVDDRSNAAGDDDEANGTGRVREFTNHRSGIEGTIDGSRYLVGNHDLFTERGWTVNDDIRSQVTEARCFGQLPVIVGRDGAAEGLIVVGDESRNGWDDTVSRLGARDMDVVVLTGDDEEATDLFKQHEDVTYVFASVPPEGKTATIRRLKSDGQVAMVGDGTNDAPALAAADLGISLGGGTALAADAADVAIVDDDIRSVETAFDLAGAARRRVKQNNLLAFAYNGIALAALAAGFFTPVSAAVAVIAGGGLVAANARRALLG
ncbi:cation-translocating P-type ATPase [Halorubrum trapanicum]|uniref:heavy metal translocating P-type ATPase n=1 Tax=Halorubrum trapanicum TaxID=29284 RepID=UPI000BBB1968|nr:heavy metal translocating P-type ATPase [Halorubrum trapanicum]